MPLMPMALGSRSGGSVSSMEKRACGLFQLRMSSVPSSNPRLALPHPGHRSAKRHHLRAGANHGTRPLRATHTRSRNHYRVEKFGGPVEIEAASFDSLRELPRAGLLLVNGQIYLTWASSCDVGPYHGWMMAYNARTLAQSAAFNTSPSADEGGIWQSDNAPAADDQVPCTWLRATENSIPV